MAKDVSKTLVIAHRGVRTRAPENALLAFQDATTLAGLDGVEFDVHLTADNEVVVFHDPVLERMSNGHGAVAGATLKQLQSLRLRKRAGSKSLISAGLPSLEQVLDVLAPTQLELHIELKVNASGAPYNGLVDKVVGIVRDYDLQQRCILTTIEPKILEQLHAYDANLSLSAAISNNTMIVLGGLALTLERLQAMNKAVPAFDRHVLQQLHASGDMSREDIHGFGVWTVNGERELGIALRLGFRHITTDQAALAIALRDKLKRNRD